MTRKMSRSVLLAALVLLPCLARAEDDRAVAVLSEELRVSMPPRWQAHVRWRDGNLLASITPLPYQTAFDLWYDNGRLFEDLRELCPGRDGEVWGLLEPTQDIILEPTVGGKSGFAARVSCRRAKLNRS